MLWWNLSFSEILLVVVDGSLGNQLACNLWTLGMLETTLNVHFLDGWVLTL